MHLLRCRSTLADAPLAQRGVVRFLRRLFSARLAVFGLLVCAPKAGNAQVLLPVSTGDVIAVLGGEDMVAWQRNGYFETLLAASLSTNPPRFRYLAQEGDTVFEQPRQLNFPGWTEQLDRIGGTAIVCQFGQNEALRGRERLPEFTAAYEKLLEVFAARKARIVLLSPTPFEQPPGDLPDLSARNDDLAAYVEAVRELAARRRCVFVNLFAPLHEAGSQGKTLTRDGLHLDTPGHWLAAREAARRLGFGFDRARRAVLAPGGQLNDPALEELRRAIVAKNQLWFDYWRPQNWAFLHGDRTEQPSSRDHRDPSVRWFPQEMEAFLSLIAAKEKEIVALANGMK